MKIKLFLPFALFLFSFQFCLAQDEPENPTVQPKEFSISPVTPYYVLKADTKTVGIMPSAENTFDLKSIDPDLIKKIDVLKGEHATNKYGDLGTNGVVVITFKNYASLSQELKDRFKDTE